MQERQTQQQKQLSDLLLDAAGIAVDRMPMLNVVFDRMAALCADSLQAMSASPCNFSLSYISNGRIGDLIKDYEANAVVGVFHTKEWDSRILVGLDRDFIFTMIEVLYGSDGAEPPLDEERAFSNVELRVAEALSDRFINALQTSFAPISQVKFKRERMETTMASVAIGRRGNMAICANIMLQALYRGGQMFVVIPHSALVPLRRSLAHVVPAETMSTDPVWSKQMQGEIQRTEVKLEAVLEERLMTLQEVSRFKVGQVIELNATMRTPARLKCNDQLLFWCKLGQSDGVYTLQIQDPIDQKKEYVNDILSH
jgi:flagellar motor switch protein FliM